ncbi:protein kinase domain-containing protein [Desulfovibrio inopinatus]|uniref:protein kinase domain-containing protein n=1 Tax=Desulfovibrio inopinatus TaxID=102109 RepID=UPI0003F9F649|nr:protein kinase [Desulfovibrio inopinatus]
MLRIDGYEILGRLGQGGEAVVYKVKAPVTGRLAALKLLKPNDFLVTLLGMDEIVRRFMIEVRLLGGLRHENLVEVFDFGRHDGNPYFVMNYFCNNLGDVIGESFRIEAPTRRLGVPRACHYVRQILDGLGRLHFEGIIHRDIKPQNILLTDQHGVRIIDFGLSKTQAGPQHETPDNLKIGTPFYTAPEQERNPESADVRSDLYAVGVMLYRMLTGELPYPDETSTFVEPSRKNTDLTEAFNVFLQKAVARSAANRFENALTMRKELDKVLEDWKSRVAGMCSLADEVLTPPSISESCSTEPIRSSPTKMDATTMQTQLNLDDLWRPHPKCKSCFTRSHDIVVDEQNHLIWQAGGSPYPVDFESAQAYIAELNDSQFGGFTDWRLPTLPELLTILTPLPTGLGLCRHDAFDTRQRRLWSTDRRTFISYWGVETELGFVMCADDTCQLSVRAVRSGMIPANNT